MTYHHKAGQVWHPSAIRTLDTAQMLDLLSSEERQSVLETARVVRHILSEMVPENRLTFSNAAMANLAYFIRVRRFKSVPLLYNENFTRAMYRYYVRRDETDISEPLMDDILAVAELCSEEELRAILRGADAHRRKGPLFDFGVLNNGAVTGA